MGQIEMEKPVASGSLLGGNQHPYQNGAFHLLAELSVRSSLNLCDSETQLFQRLATHLIAQMSIVLLDHLDRGARYLSNGQKINTLMNKVRDGRVAQSIGNRFFWQTGLGGRKFDAIFPCVFMPSCLCLLTKQRCAGLGILGLFQAEFKSLF